MCRDGLQSIPSGESNAESSILSFPLLITSEF